MQAKWVFTNDVQGRLNKFVDFDIPGAEVAAILDIYVLKMIFS